MLSQIKLSSEALELHAYRQTRWNLTTSLSERGCEFTWLWLQIITPFLFFFFSSAVLLVGDQERVLYAADQQDEGSIKNDVVLKNENGKERKKSKFWIFNERYDNLTKGIFVFFVLGDWEKQTKKQLI